MGLLGVMPSRSLRMAIGLSISGFLARSRNVTELLPPAFVVRSCVLTSAWRCRSARWHAGLRKASSRSCAPAFGVVEIRRLNVSGEGRKVTAVPLRPYRCRGGSVPRRCRTTASGASASPCAEAHLVDLPVPADGQIQPPDSALTTDTPRRAGRGHLVGVWSNLPPAGSWVMRPRPPTRLGRVRSVGDAAAVVGHGAGAVGVERHRHQVGMAASASSMALSPPRRHVVRARAVVGVADIHARPLRTRPTPSIP